LRRNDHSSVTTILLILLLWPGVILFSQETVLEVVESEEKLAVSAELRSASVEEVFTSLEDGLEAEIAFEIRLYERTRGILSFIGDRLVLHSQPFYRAKKNFFENTYVVNASWGMSYEFADPQDFLKLFLSIDTFELDGFRPKKGKHYYLRARIHLNHVKLAPPLNLIYILGPIGITTEWTEARIQ
jgi:hypothetical protein